MDIYKHIKQRIKRQFMRKEYKWSINLGENT